VRIETYQWVTRHEARNTFLGALAWRQNGRPRFGIGRAELFMEQA
jgi:hypothetical protein